MAKDDKQTKAPASQKTETVTKDSGASTESESKTEGGEKSTAAPASYSRGEGQKAVTAAYRDNWNLIFRKKKKR